MSQPMSQPVSACTDLTTAAQEAEAEEMFWQRLAVHVVEIHNRELALESQAVKKRRLDTNYSSQVMNESLLNQHTAYVYLRRAYARGHTYIGSTIDAESRLEEHNRGPQSGGSRWRRGSLGSNVDSFEFCFMISGDPRWFDRTFALSLESFWKKKMRGGKRDDATMVDQDMKHQKCTSLPI
jgi:hypothetical protein